jgi:hypothetical protein
MDYARLRALRGQQIRFTGEIVARFGQRFGQGSITYFPGEIFDRQGDAIRLHLCMVKRTVLAALSLYPKASGNAWQVQLETEVRVMTLPHPWGLRKCGVAVRQGEPG